MGILPLLLVTVHLIDQQTATVAVATATVAVAVATATVATAIVLTHPHAPVDSWKICL